MGCKSFDTFSPNQIVSLDLISNTTTTTTTIDLQILSCMSGSMTYQMKHGVNLINLAQFLRQTEVKFTFEPEIFPALRLTKFNPLCVNIFSSGKCVILGLTSKNRAKPIIREIKQLMRCWI